MAKLRLDSRARAGRRSARRGLAALLVILLLLAGAAIALTGGRDVWVTINLLAQSHAADADRNRH